MKWWSNQQWNVVSSIKDFYFWASHLVYESTESFPICNTVTRLLPPFFEMSIHSMTHQYLPCFGWNSERISHFLWIPTSKDYICNIATRRRDLPLSTGIRTSYANLTIFTTALSRERPYIGESLLDRKIIKTIMKLEKYQILPSPPKNVADIPIPVTGQKRNSLCLNSKRFEGLP